MAKTVSDPTNHHSSVVSSRLISMIAMLLGFSDGEYITLVTRKGNMRHVRNRTDKKGLARCG